MTLNDILKMAVNKGASDIHLKVGIVPVYRKHGKLRPIEKNLPILTSEYIEKLVKDLISKEQYQKYMNNKELDIGYGLRGFGRFRINIFRQRGSSRIVIRNIPDSVPQISDLQLPPAIKKVAEFERGLVLVTGATGSGKSSTLAAIIDHINKNRNRHILTIEDPIEFLIRDKKSIITQRELGIDTKNFSTSLRSALRQDPDVIFIGEMRDLETIETALIAAETGHLVLSTLHTLNAQETINRILSVFDTNKQAQIRVQLAAVLKTVVSQRLAQRADGKGFIPAVEIMFNNARIQDMISNPEKTNEIHLAIEESHATYQMQSFDQSLMYLVTNGFITFEEAQRLSDNQQDFSIRYSGVTAHESSNDPFSSSEHQKKVANAWEDLDEVEIDDD